MILVRTSAIVHSSRTRISSQSCRPGGLRQCSPSQGHQQSAWTKLRMRMPCTSLHVRFLFSAWSCSLNATFC